MTRPVTASIKATANHKAGHRPFNANVQPPNGQGTGDKGPGTQDTGHRTQVPGHGRTGPRTWDTGHRTQDTRPPKSTLGLAGNFILRNCFFELFASNARCKS